MNHGDIRVRHSRRARRLRIDVSARSGVVVVVPEGTPRRVVERFVEDRREWIRRARDRVEAEAAALVPADAEPCPERIDLRAVGRSVAVETTAPGAQRRTVDAGDRLRLEGIGGADEARAQLVRWLKREARRTLVPRLEALARDHGLRYERASVRGQRTRWASCSGRGTISLNFRLLFLPLHLVEHVLLHELAHTRHLDHSPRFWRLLARLDPQWRRHHEELRDARRWIPAWVEMD